MLMCCVASLHGIATVTPPSLSECKRAKRFRYCEERVQAAIAIVDFKSSPHDAFVRCIN